MNYPMTIAIHIIRVWIKKVLKSVKSFKKAQNSFRDANFRNYCTVLKTTWGAFGRFLDSLKSILNVLECFRGIWRFFDCFRSIEGFGLFL